MMDWKWVWITLAVFALLTAIPIWIYPADERVRKIINWVILIPLSLVVVFYIYPAGIEFFEWLATGGLRGAH
ncbi:MAG: hypothetical protein Q8R76_08120 [Candidatus Omnitrophota bacterium]|nr:hypothetical protein [Candidatus Omnitrophota bacterium]